MKRFAFPFVLLFGVIFAQEDSTYNYKSLYENGFYEDAIRLLEVAVNQPPDSALQEPRKLLAFCYIMTNRVPDAEVIFRRMFVRNPEYALDPILTPPRFYEVFHRVRREWRDSPEGRALLALESARKDSLQTELLRKRLPSARGPAYVRIPVSLLPGGAGQFYHKKTYKGLAFFAVQSAALGAALWSYNRREDFKDPQLGWTPANKAENDRYIRYMRIEFSVFTFAYLAGVADAFFITPEKEKRR